MGGTCCWGRWRLRSRPRALGGRWSWCVASKAASGRPRGLSGLGLALRARLPCGARRRGPSANSLREQARSVQTAPTSLLSKRAARAATPPVLLGGVRYAPAAARSQPCHTIRCGARVNSILWPPPPVRQGPGQPGGGAYRLVLSSAGQSAQRADHQTPSPAARLPRALPAPPQERLHTSATPWIPNKSSPSASKASTSC